MSTQSHVWENPELKGETKKKKKKGIGGLVEKFKDVKAHAMEIIKEPLAAPHENVPASTTNVQQQEVPQEVSQDVPHDVARDLGAALLLPVQQALNAESQKKSIPQEEVSQDVPHDIARNLGAVLFLPVQQALGAESLKSTLPQATSLGHHLGTTGELRAEDDPQLKGKNFEIEKSQPLNSQVISATIEKARSLENVFTTKGTQIPQSPLNFQDFLHSSLGEARKLGERMGTTSPQGEKKLSLSQKPVFKPKYTPKTQQGFQFQKKPQEEEGKLAADFLKAHVAEARKIGERMGTTSPKGNVGSTVSTYSPVIEGELAAEFLQAHVGEARKLGEQMGTTSPKGKSRFQTKSKKSGISSKGISTPVEGKAAADFLRAHVGEARKLGERMGTTSPKGKSRFQTKSFKTKPEEEGKLAADFLKAHVAEARKIGERMGTTSPKGKFRFQTKGKFEQYEGKSAADFLRAHVGEARKIGERMGTTSPKGKTRFQTKPEEEGKLAADFLKAHVAEARKIGERMGTTSPKGKFRFQTKGKFEQYEGKSAADFLRAHVGEARKIGERMGTTSPHVHFKPKSEGKSATDFLKAHVGEARKIGERMGTTSPKEKYRYASPSVTSSSLEIEGTQAAQFLRANLNEARKLGEKKGTTSPKNVHLGTKEGVVHHPSGIDFLRESVGKARELGEKKGTTSPKPESLLFRYNQLKEEAARKKSVSHKE